MKLKEIKKNEGITLLALVITIIVLVILATVSLNAVLGEDGLINQAKLAKLEYRASTVEEEVMMWKAEQEFASYQGSGSFKLKDELIEDQLSRGLLTEEEAKEAKEKSVVKIGSKTISYEGEIGGTLDDAIDNGRIFSGTVKYDEAGNKIEDGEDTTPAITIPAGFKIIEGNRVEEGIVIADSQGNEFVWVPCTETEYKSHDYSGRTDKNDEVYNLEDDSEGGWNTGYYTVYTDWKDNGGDAASVKKYGGFYIARYEAGIPSNAIEIYVDANSDNKTYATDEKNTNAYKPVSKKGMQVWNYIDQTNAMDVSQKMYENSYSVTSQLVDGKAWDRTVDWIVESHAGVEKDSTNNGNYANNTGLTISSNVLYAQHLEKRTAQNGGAGWNLATVYQYGKPKSGTVDPYKGDFSKNQEGELDTVDHYRQLLELSTGASEKTKLNNIYDLAGNVFEWTTETGNHQKSDNSKGESTYAVHRGGGFHDDGDSIPITFRNGYHPQTLIAPDVGFRVVLYVK